MNDTVKMKKKNIDGIEIIKDIPNELYSNYIAIGWEKVKETKDKPSFTKTIKDNEK